MDERGDERPTVRIDVWSDVVCPWCYIGKRRFERAVAQVSDSLAVEVTYRPYQLDPTAPPGVSQPVVEAYARKFGGPERAREIIDHVTAEAAGEGIEFRLDRAQRANTLLAHRLIWRAGQPGSPTAQPDMKERLLRAYFIDGIDIGDPDRLAECAVEVGFAAADIEAFLASDEGRAEVGDELALAAELGITAVPTFVVDDQWAIPGAQPTETFVRILLRLVEQT